MPTALYFKLAILVEEKPNIELSSFQLYDGNSRVDSAAIISSGFESNQTNLDILKNDPPTSGVSLNILDTTAFRRSQFYVIWKFSVATNVNAFRVGTGSTQSTTVDKFSLSYSDDGSIYTNFINIGLDKRLSYPGPWQLTELKPVGQCFPLVFRRGKDYSTNMNASFYTGDDGRSFGNNSSDIWPVEDTINNPSAGIIVTNGSTLGGNFSNEIPGIYEVGKYYFEVSAKNRNKVETENGYSFLTLVLIPDNTERCISPSVANSPLLSLASSFSGYLNTGKSYNANYNGVSSAGYYASRTLFTPGYQNGFSIDFDNSEIKYYNPTWNSQGVGPFVIPGVTSYFKLMPTGTKYKLFVFFDYYMGSFFSGVQLNVGQSSFNNTVPSGFESGLGPRWKEEIDSTLSFNTFTFDGFNRDMEPYNMVNVYGSPEIKNQTSFYMAGGGLHYIKGTISKVPDIQNKRFIAQLYSLQSRSMIADCVVTSSGLYEFYGIEYGAYIITSIDLLNNTVAESIGPVYPLPII